MDLFVSLMTHVEKEEPSSLAFSLVYRGSDKKETYELWGMGHVAKNNLSCSQIFCSICFHFLLNKLKEKRCWS